MRDDTLLDVARQLNDCAVLEYAARGCGPADIFCPGAAGRWRPALILGWARDLMSLRGVRGRAGAAA